MEHLLASVKYLLVTSKMVAAAAARGAYAHNRLLLAPPRLLLLFLLLLHVRLGGSVRRSYKLNYTLVGFPLDKVA